MTQNTFGARIAQKRTEADLTQAALAARLGVSAQAISKWETGAGYPDVETIPLLARALGTTTDALFGMEEEKKEEPAFDPEKWKAEIVAAVSEEMEEKLSELRDEIESMLDELPGSSENKETKKVLFVCSHDRSKIVACIGGVRIDNTANGGYLGSFPPFALVVQTQKNGYEALQCYDVREEAIADLCRIKEAFDRGETSLQL